MARSTPAASPRPVARTSRRTAGPPRRKRRRPPAQGSRSPGATLGMHERFRDRRRAVRDAGLRRTRRLLASAVAVVVLVGLAVAVTYSPLFTIAEIRVTGATGERAEEVRRAVPAAPGDNLLFVDVPRTDAAVERVPWVADATVTRIPPSTLDVAVTVREPVAVVRLADASWLVDGEGVLIGGGAEDGLVRIDAREAVLPSVGQPVEDADVRSAIALQAGFPAALRKRVLRYESTPGEPLRMLVRLDDPEAEQGLWVRVGDAERVEAKGLAVELILQRAQAEGRDLDGSIWDVRAPERPVFVPPAPPAEG